jgi:hypothetical protein
MVKKNGVKSRTEKHGVVSYAWTTAVLATHKANLNIW